MNRIVLISLCFLLVSCSFKKPEKKYYSQGLKFKKNAQFAEAIDSFKKVIDISPRSERARESLYMLGDIYYQIGDINNAVRMFEAYINIAVLKGKKGFSILKKIAWLYHSKLNAEDEALKYYIKSLNLAYSKKQRFESFLGIGSCYFKMNRFNHAIEYLSKALKEGERIGESYLSPKIQEVLYYTGFSYYILGRKVKEGFQNRRYEVINSDMIKKAVEALDKCIEYSDESKYGILCRYQKAEALLDIDEKKGALALFIELRSVYPNPTVIESRIAQIEGMRHE